MRKEVLQVEESVLVHKNKEGKDLFFVSLEIQ